MKPRRKQQYLNLHWDAVYVDYRGRQMAEGNYNDLGVEYYFLVGSKVWFTRKYDYI